MAKDKRCKKTRHECLHYLKDNKESGQCEWCGKMVTKRIDGEFVSYKPYTGKTHYHMS